MKVHPRLARWFYAFAVVLLFGSSAPAAPDDPRAPRDLPAPSGGSPAASGSGAPRPPRFEVETPPDLSSIGPRDLRERADHVVDSTRQLRKVLDQQLRDGDLVFLERGTYRTRRFLDVNADSVALVGAGARESILKPADGSNVGGFRVGTAGPVSNFRLASLGYHGNTSAMDTSIKRLHGIELRHCIRCLVEDVFVTRTHPYHEHNTGGSGITVGHASRHVTLRRVTVSEVGDRGIQIGGENVRVLNSTFRRGFDRSIALDYQDHRDRWWVSRRVLIQGNRMIDNASGSLVGASQVPTRPNRGRWIVRRNRGGGNHAAFVVIGHCFRDTPYSEIYVLNNRTRRASTYFDKAAIHLRCPSDPREIVIRGNQIEGGYPEGILAQGGANHLDTGIIEGNAIVGVQDTGIRIAGPYRISGNLIAHAGAGVQLGGGDRIAAEARVTGNYVRSNRREGILVAARGHLNTLRHNVLSDNNVSGNDHAEIDVGEARHNRILNNILVKSRTSGPFFRRNSRNRFENNHRVRLNAFGTPSR